MSSTMVFVGYPEDGKSCVTKSASVLPTVVRSEGEDSIEDITHRVPNAPKSCIAEIFSTEGAVNNSVKNGNIRPRAVRDTPTRPRDTHTRLFGQVNNSPVTPLVTDTIRSQIQFSDALVNGSQLPSPVKMNGGLTNGSAGSTPSRGEPELNGHSRLTHMKPMKRNPVTGDGIALPPTRRCHPGANREGNPITGQGYSSRNGVIHMTMYMQNNVHSRVPPGGYSSGLW